MSVNSKMTAIADEIRAKTGGTEPLSLDDMAENVPKVYESGQNNIKEQVEPINAELEKCLSGNPVDGKTWYDKFWDSLQKNGSRTWYEYTFFGVWTDEMFNPKSPLVSTNATQMFARNNLTKIDVPISISGTNSTNVFYASPITRIKLLKVSANTSFSGWFNSCTSLVELNIEGTISYDFNIQHSNKLNKTSIESIINALSTTTTGLSITLSGTAVANAFAGAEWQALVSSKPNWTISLV